MFLRLYAPDVFMHQTSDFVTKHAVLGSKVKVSGIETHFRSHRARVSSGVVYLLHARDASLNVWIARLEIRRRHGEEVH